MNLFCSVFLTKNKSVLPAEVNGTNSRPCSLANERYLGSWCWFGEGQWRWKWGDRTDGVHGIHRAGMPHCLESCQQHYLDHGIQTKIKQMHPNKHTINKYTVTLDNTIVCHTKQNVPATVTLLLSPGLLHKKQQWQTSTNAENGFQQEEKETIVTIAWATYSFARMDKEG